MPRVDLATLTGLELRRLLDSSRGRGDAALSYQVLQEMAARRQGRATQGRAVKGPFRKRPAAEPRLVGVDLGDPMEEADDLPPMPFWRAPAPPAATAAAPQRATAEMTPPRSWRPPEPAEAPVEVPTVEAEAPRAPRRSRRKPAPQPLRLDDAADPPPAALDEPFSLNVPEPAPEPEPTEAAEPQLLLRLAEARAAPRPARLRLAAGFAAGIAVGVGLGWWGAGALPLASLARARPALSAAAPAAVAAPRAATVRTASAAPAASGLVIEPKPSEASGGSAPANVVGDLASAAQAPDPAAEAPGPPRSEPAAAAQLAEARPDARPEARPEATPVRDAGGCGGQPTPADREICTDPALQRLQRELRRAYSEALDAHQDRALLRQRQLAWRDARNTVSDPQRLAALYEQRIRKLNAAAAAARRQ